MSDKVKDIELPEFVAMVLDSDDKVANQVREANIDAEAIIAKHKKVFDKYGVSTGIGFAVARLNEAIVEANSDSLTGLLVGQRDRYNTKAPVRIPVLSKTGDHIEVINWGTTVKQGDAKVEIPYPCIGSLRVLTEGEFKGVPSVKLVSAEKFENLSASDAILRLGKVAKSVGEVDGGDELHVVVVRGKISYVAPATKWKGKERDGSWQIWLPNQRDTPAMHPVMQISLETEGGNMVRAIFERQQNSVPTVMVEDFLALCEDASKTSTDPVEQARFFGEIIRGREVIIVGFITKYSQQSEVNYVDMNAYAIFDAKAGKSAPKPKIEDHEESEDEPESETEDEAPAKKSAPAKKPAPATKKGKDGSGAADALKGKIKNYIDLLGLSVSDITAETVIKLLAPDKSKSFVNQILEEMAKE